MISRSVFSPSAMAAVKASSKRVAVMTATLSWIWCAVAVAVPPNRTDAQPGSGGRTGIPKGYMVIEGDIIVPVDFYEQGGPATTFTVESDLWPGGVVPYAFDTDINSTGYVSTSRRSAMITAMGNWEAAASVDFRARSSQTDYIFIQDANNNSSFIGRIGGRQAINIFNWSFEFIMAHELGHALGYWHEQTRADRGSFVQIIWGNIPTDKQSNFQTRPQGGEYGPYDFDSVMHYNECSFSSCSGCPSDSGCTNGGRTIVVKPPNDTVWQSGIGQRNHLSAMDQLTMSFLYPRSSWRFVDIAATGAENGTFLSPYHSFLLGIQNTPTSGTLWVQPGSYGGIGTYGTPVTVLAPLGGVVLGN